MLKERERFFNNGLFLVFLPTYSKIFIKNIQHCHFNEGNDNFIIGLYLISIPICSKIFMKKSALSILYKLHCFFKKRNVFLIQGSVKALNAKNARLSDVGVSRRKSVPARSSIPPISCKYIPDSEILVISGFEWELHLCTEGTLQMHAASFSFIHIHLDIKIAF